MLARLKGLILSNFIYLIIFYLIYFTMVLVALYTKEQICGLDIFATYCSSTIPESTTAMMNFMLFVVVPLAAMAVTILSSTPQQSYVD